MCRERSTERLVEGLEMPVSSPAELDDGMFEELGGETVGNRDILPVTQVTAVPA